MRRLGAGGLFGAAGVQRELALALQGRALALQGRALALAVPARIPRIPERSLGRGL